MQRARIIDRIRHRHLGIALGSLLAVGALVGLSLSASSGSGRAHLTKDSDHARLLDSSCNGPVGTAYVADAGYDAFSAIDTANCQVLQTYNVDDPGNPGDPDNANYSSTSEAVVASNGELYFADTGSSTVAVIDIANLNVANYNPAETLINVGFFPEALAVTPDGNEVWVANTGPQTSSESPSDLSVIDTATNAVVATVPLPGDPRGIAFSPDGKTAYVTTARGVAVLDVATDSLMQTIADRSDPRGVAVAPDGSLVYVTNAANGTLSVISTASDDIVGTIAVGSLPWQVLFSSNGALAYVANPDSNSVSVIDVATSAVTATISVADDPDTLALTPDGSELWVGENAGGSVSVIDTASNDVASNVDLGTAYEPTGIAITG